MCICLHGCLSYVLSELHIICCLKTRRLHESENLEISKQRTTLYCVFLFFFISTLVWKHVYKTGKCSMCVWKHVHKPGNHIIIVQNKL